MKINNLTVTSLSKLNFELAPTKPVCILRGQGSDTALDLIRELIGDLEVAENPDLAGDGRYVIHSDVEMDGKIYSACYIHNADYIGDNRIGVNFEPDSINFSVEDTYEFIEKSRKKSADASHALVALSPIPKNEDGRPLFVYHLDRVDQSRAMAYLDELARSNRQVFVAVCGCFPDIQGENIQTLSLN